MLASTPQTTLIASSLLIVFACDERYAMPLATALRSLVESSAPGAWPVRVHVLTDGFGRAERDRVARSLPTGSAAIRWTPVDLEMFAGLKTVPGVTPLTFARLLIPLVLPDHIDRVLYLDTDVLVQKDLMPLWQTDLGGAAAGAVIDSMDAQFRQGTRQVSGVPRVASYFNAGVLLIDVARWRQLQVSERALAYLRSHAQSPYMDQDGLNVALDGSWTSVDPQWNFQDHYATEVASLHGPARPAIVHFVTSLKPWFASSLSPNWLLYDRVRRRTAYARSRGEILNDALVRQWHRTKRMLRQFRAIRMVERRLRPRAAVVSPEL